MLKGILMSLLFLMPGLCFAQGGGHVGKHGVQQQQISRLEYYVYRVVRGVEAKLIYEALLAEPKVQEIDLSDVCEKPVKSISSYLHGEKFICFDRGESFNAGSQYKCYQRKVHPSGWWWPINNIQSMIHPEPNQCGGSGNHPIKIE